MNQSNLRVEGKQHQLLSHLYPGFSSMELTGGVTSWFFYVSC